MDSGNIINTAKVKGWNPHDYVHKLENLTHEVNKMVIKLTTFHSQLCMELHLPEGSLTTSISTTSILPQLCMSRFDHKY